MGVIATMVAVAVLTYGVSVQPGAAIVKLAFEAGAEPPPAPGSMVAVRDATVTVGVPVAVSGAPTAALDIYRPAQPTSSPLPVVLWVHGGGFIANSSWMVSDYAARLAASGYVVASLDYSLAPRSRYPTPVRQADAAFAFLRDHAAEYGGDSAAFFLGGDSAGAQIASETAVVETDPAFASRVGITPSLAAGQLRGVVLFCGLYDMRTVGQTGFPALRTFLWSYTGRRDYLRYDRIEELSTTGTASAAYPATFIAVGDADPFEPQAIELTSALRDRGVDVTTEFWTGSGRDLPHEYQFDVDADAGRTTFAHTLDFLARHRGETGGR
ncbi:alpha/beta hydrolase [Raineyella sp. W15-4]|uniref:alpha/beta hydrolase n=1 Tax=Raineyella sp. W15-4 TaxID=3081651 RepID=UPI002952F730|nr:alpha/beta hydrolase [Raineyella sp. W15-4]WOQ18722.1 alpha/beta hydrolase [Raineyella sp. W15-4]